MSKLVVSVPSILSFESKLLPSAGRFFGTNWIDRSSSKPLTLKEISVRGTMSNRLKKSSSGDPAKLNAEIEKANLQTVDSCSLSGDQDTLHMSFTLRFLSGVNVPSSCNNIEFKRIYSDSVSSYINKFNFKELSKRYSTNIANGRFLWRNRVGASRLEVIVKAKLPNEEKVWTFDSKSIGLNDFNSSNRDLLELADHISATLSGKSEFLLLEIDAYAQLGNGQAVYPSEELVLDKSNSKSKKSKILYQIDGAAGMHSQKIGNALRTIDTWYPGYGEINISPIAAECYGSVTSLGKAFRTPKDKADFYSLFDKFSTGG